MEKGRQAPTINILRSCPSNNVAYVKFMNVSIHTVSLEWIDFQGHHKKVAKLLRPQEQLSIKTYVGHPWVAYESKYRHAMAFSTDKAFVYFPVASVLNSGVPTQSHIKIITPMHTLERLCLQVLHKYAQIDESVIMHLDIPHHLQQKLQKLFFNQRNTDILIRMNEVV
ncbi:unnamed protein product [Clavelina lepadiformis]|uniref:von Hippel-Lindau disease tumour suppressor beta domain-containing protein n=1 Tax=Clavelina lepadiformis TaxID=159417 RepID=A0ABP0GYA2_CLALP